SPSTFSMTAPLGNTFNITDGQGNVSFTWTKSVDPEAQEVKYTLHLQQENEQVDFLQFEAGTSEAYEVLTSILKDSIFNKLGYGSFTFDHFATASDGDFVTQTEKEKVVFILDDTSSSLEQEDQSGWTVFPNPTHDWIVINAVNSGSSFETVQIFNALGQKVKSVSSKKIYVGEMPAGQ